MGDAIVRPVGASPAKGPPHSTPPSSPTKCVQTKPQKSTPLHRRFLKEVSMSPATPTTPTTPATPATLAKSTTPATPATPPRTPSRARQPSPSKEQASPTKDRSAPGKCRKSPAKLEIGQNGFYFSCEIPMSKITPKKQVKPQKSSRAGTPTQATTSPLKNVTPLKRNPARVLFGTPTKSTADIAKGDTTTPASPPGASDTVSRKATNNVSPPTSRVQSGRATNTTDVYTAGPFSKDPPVSVGQPVSKASKEKAGSKLQPENIGCMMARLSSGSFRTHDWTNADHSVDPTKSPMPTPLRRASERLFAAAPPDLQMEADQREMVVGEPMKKPDIHESPCNKAKYFDEGKRARNNPIGNSREPKTCYRRNPAGAKVITASPDKNDTIKNALGEQHSSPHRVVPIHKTKTEKEPKVVAPPHRLEEHVQRRGLRASPTKTKQEPISQQRRAGTNPKVLLAMQKDMASIGERFRQSFEAAQSTSRNSTYGVSETSNVIATHDLDAAKLKVQSAPKAHERLMRCRSDTPATCTRRTSALEGARERAATIVGMGLPQWRLSQSTSAQTRCEDGIAVTEADVKTVKSKQVPVTTLRSRPVNTARCDPLKPAAKVTSTSNRPPRTSRPTATPARPPFGTVAKKQTPVATRVKGRAIPPTTTRTAQNPKIPSPTGCALPITKGQMTTRQSVPKTPRPTRVLRTTKSQPSLPYDPSIKFSSFEEQFVDAAEIAERIRQWHNEDLEKMSSKTTFEIPGNKIPAQTPSKTPQPSPAVRETRAEAESTQSTTPPGSPSRPPVPPPSEITMALPIRANAKISAATPKKPAARTPRPMARTPAPAAVASTDPAMPRFLGTPRCNQRIPRTPAQSRIATIDRNAFRTPSKAIESSLDRAIDEKLKEDARRGREFTPGGQKIKELLGILSAE